MTALPYAGLTVAVVLFLVGMKLTRIVDEVYRMLAATRQAMATIRAPDLDDEEKEVLVQRAAVRMFGFFFSITIKAVLILAVSAGVAALGIPLGLYQADTLADAAVDPYFLIATTVVVILLWKVLK